MALKTRTVLLTGGGLALVAGLSFVAFGEDPVPVDLATVTQGQFEITINADGQTRVRDLYEVAAPISGTAMRSPVDVGDRVIADETIVAVVRPASSGLLDDRSRLQAEATLQEALAAQQVALADLQQARETRSFANSQFERTKALVTRGVASITQLENETQRLRVADAGLEAAQARTDMAQGAVERARAGLLDPAEAEEPSNVCCIELRAPIDGIVLSVSAISERPVSIGAPLVSLGDPDDLELVADILSNDAVRLLPGALAYVDRWGGSEPLLAKLDRIDPKAKTKVSALGIEEQRVDAYFALTSEKDDRHGLGDGFSVFLRIVEWQSEDVTQVPLSSVFRRGEDWSVFVFKEGVAELREVTLGRRNGQMTQVESGLEVGEMVVTHPSDAIADGVALVERTEL